MRKTPDGKKIENFDLCERRVLEQSRQYWNVHKIEASRDIFGLDQAIVVVQRKIVSLIIIIWITWLVCFCLQIWRLCSQPRNCDLRFSLGRGKEICVFSWGQFIDSRYYCYFYYCFWRYFFFHLMLWYGARTWSTSLWASKFMFVFRWNFSFPFPLLADFVSVCLIPPSSPSDWPFLLPFPTWKKYQGRKLATANRRPFWKVIWSNFRIWFSSFYLWCSKTPNS